jgi:hypothetical protein
MSVRISRRRSLEAETVPEVIIIAGSGGAITSACRRRYPGGQIDYWFVTR